MREWLKADIVGKPASAGTLVEGGSGDGLPGMGEQSSSYVRHFSITLSPPKSGFPGCKFLGFTGTNLHEASRSWRQRAGAGR